MRILIIRHGEPDYSIDSLTQKGFREAEFLSERLCDLKEAYFYCSPLGRAKDTANATLTKINKQPVICDWLEEFSGFVIDKSGEKKIPWDKLPSFWTKDKRFFDRNKWTSTPLIKSGDTEKKYKWVCDGLDHLLEKHGYKRENNYYRAITPNHDTLVLFCHFGVECVLLSRLLNIAPALLWHGFIALPTSVTTLITEEREEGIAYFRCNSFGDLSHLYKHNEPPSFAGRFCEEYSNMKERH